MRKLILGIAAVFCAQIAFQVFVAIDDYRARYYSVQLADPVADEPIEIAALSDEDEFEQANEPSPAPNRSPAKRAVRGNGALQTAYTPIRTTAAGMDTIVILIPKPAQPGREPQPMSREPVRGYAVTTRQVERPQKRSFFAKALPVLKKPYDLLKLVGSKLH